MTMKDEAFDVEQRMVGLGQPVQRQHAKHGRDGGKQHGQLERYRNERGPAKERPAADVDRVVIHRRETLHAKAGQSAGDAAHQHDQRQAAVVKADGLVESLHRKRRVGFHLPVAVRVGAPGRSENRVGALKLRQQTVQRRFFDEGHRGASPFSTCSATCSRSSNMEIIGNSRMNRNISVKNNPTDPNSVAQSQNVG